MENNDQLFDQVITVNLDICTGSMVKFNIVYVHILYFTLKSFDGIKGSF